MTRLCSKHLELNENGTAVAVDKWFVRSTSGAHRQLMGLSCRGKREKEEEESSEEEEEEEEESEEESEEEETPQQAELTRAQRKELKKSKKQATQRAEDEDEDEDAEPLTANPNLASAKQMSLSALNAPRELSRKER